MGEKYRPIDSLMNYATYKNSYCLQVKKKISALYSPQDFIV